MGTGSSSGQVVHEHGYGQPTGYRYPVTPLYYVESVPASARSGEYGESSSDREVKYWDTPLNVWDEKRDIVFSRILSAEEFLVSMKKIDDDVRDLSQREDRESQMPRITEALGLRGHMQGELLRIQKMLAEDDPTLKCIAEYEASHAEVVEKLREMHAEGSRIQTDGGRGAIVQVDLLLKDRGLTTVSLGTSTDSTGHGTIGTQCDSLGRVSKSTGMHSTHGVDADTSLDDIDNEEDLKKKHKAEEARMAARYARVIARGRQMSVEEINSLLSDHARSVQALRMKQEEERRRLLLKLNEKRTGSGLVGDGAGTKTDPNLSTAKKGSKSRNKRREKQKNAETEEKIDKKSQRKKTDNTNDASRILDEHSNAINGLRSKQESEKQKFAKLLEQKRAEMNGTIDNGDEFSSDDDDHIISTNNVDKRSFDGSTLEDIVQQLEEMRLRGELNSDAAKQLMAQYYKLSATGGSDGNDVMKPSRRHYGLAHPDSHSNQISANQLLEETHAKQKQIKNKRQQEKEIVAEKLRQKLESRTTERRPVEIEGD